MPGRYLLDVIERDDGRVGLYRSLDVRRDWSLSLASEYDSFLKNRNWKVVFQFAGLDHRGCKLVHRLVAIAGDDCCRPVMIDRGTRLTWVHESGRVIEGDAIEVAEKLKFHWSDMKRNAYTGQPVAGGLLFVSDFLLTDAARRENKVQPRFIARSS